MHGGGGEEHGIDNRPLPSSDKGVSRGVEERKPWACSDNSTGLIWLEFKEQVDKWSA